MDATTLSTTFEEASSKTRSVYRAALRDIPNMRQNFTIIEDEAFVRKVIRDLFEKHRHVSDIKVIDMLAFKALQELREIREQWKSRTHLYGYIHQYTEHVLREDRDKIGDHYDGKDEILRVWRERGLVPVEIANWTMYEQWREEEDAKFKSFAVENKLFTEEQLERNKNADVGCTMM